MEKNFSAEKEFVVRMFGESGNSQFWAFVIEGGEISWLSIAEKTKFFIFWIWRFQFEFHTFVVEFVTSQFAAADDTVIEVDSII